MWIVFREFYRVKYRYYAAFTDQMLSSPLPLMEGDGYLDEKFLFRQTINYLMLLCLPDGERRRLEELLFQDVPAQINGLMNRCH